ncbi:MAG TPA: tyrosine-type recombinase/integrase [Gammaproteobacteria bacterium]|nr:tyrosine-type recombinase/integrase [Gammaproteobacteria bacterium]
MHARLTKSLVDRISAPQGTQPEYYRDTQLTGFALRVTPNGAKSFIVETRINGRNRRKTLGRYGPLTVEQGRKAAQQFLGDVARGGDPVTAEKTEAARNMTLQEVLEDYLRVRKDLKPGTIHDYRRHLRESFPDWAGRPLVAISKDAVARRHQKIGERSPARANNAMRVLRALFNFARGQYEDADGNSLFPENPVDRLSHTRAWFRVERRRTLIRRSQLPAWFEAVFALKEDGGDEQSEGVADLLLLVLFTGLRREEAMSLRWEAVDLKDRTLTIADTKNREPVTLPLSDFLTDLLRARAKKAASPYVFPGSGRTGHLKEPRPQIAKVIETSGVTFTLHDLRRTFITLAESVDIPYYALKQLVNHKVNGDVTAGYIVTNVERLREPAERIANTLLAAGQVTEVDVPVKRVPAGGQASPHELPRPTRG